MCKTIKHSSIRVTIKTPLETYTGILPGEYEKEVKVINSHQKTYNTLTDKVERKRNQIDAYQKDLTYWEAYKSTEEYSASTRQRQALIEKWINEKTAKVEEFKAERVELDRQRSAVRKLMIDFFTPERFEAFTKQTTYTPGKLNSTSYRVVNTDRVLKRGLTLNVGMQLKARGTKEERLVYIPIQTDGERKTSELIEGFLRTPNTSTYMHYTNLGKKSLADVERVYVEERKPTKDLKPSKKWCKTG